MPPVPPLGACVCVGAAGAGAGAADVVVPPPAAGAVVVAVVSVPVVSVPVVDVVDVVPVVLPARASAPAGRVRSGVDFGTLSPTLSSAPQPATPRAAVATTSRTSAAGIRERIGRA